MTANENETLENKIVHQLEYYFGDINLPRDKFLQEKMKEDEGWIKIETLLTFNRLAKLCPESEVISKAVKAADSDIVSVSDCGTKIRRNIGNPLPENSLEYWQKLKHITVYMKGFPLETTLDQIMAYAAKFGNVSNVLMRRTKPERTFKGSIFATYKTREEAENAQKSDEPFEGITLIKMMQDDFWVAKCKETKEKRAAEKLAKDLKKEEDLKQKLQVQNQVTFVRGLILAVDGLPEAAKMNEVKDFFKKFGEVAYTVREENTTNAEIRFQGTQEFAAKEAWDKAVAAATDGKVMYQESEITGRVLDGEEEETYWNAFNQQKMNRNANNARGRGRGRGRGGRGGRGGGRGGKRGKRATEEGCDAPKAKRTVFADDE